MNPTTINVGEKLFEFATRQEWINKAKSWYGAMGATHHNSIAIDTKGRVCAMGRHFSRAESDGAYPITVWNVED